MAALEARRKPGGGGLITVHNTAAAVHSTNNLIMINNNSSISGTTAAPAKMSVSAELSLKSTLIGAGVSMGAASSSKSSSSGSSSVYDKKPVVVTAPYVSSGKPNPTTVAATPAPAAVACTPEQAEEQFRELLVDRQVSAVMKFKDISDLCSRDPRWNALRTVGERKQAIAVYQVCVCIQECENE